MDGFEGPEKQQILGDLERIGRWFGGRRSIRLALRRLVSAGEPFSILDIGAASGNSGRYIRSLYPRASVVSLDYRLEHLCANTDPKIVADAFHLPFRAKTFDVVFSFLFCTTLTNPRSFLCWSGSPRSLSEALLPSICSGIPLPTTSYRSPPLCSGGTGSVHDGIRSVQAAFTKSELLRSGPERGFGERFGRRRSSIFPSGTIGSRTLKSAGVVTQVKSRNLRPESIAGCRRRYP